MRITINPATVQVSPGGKAALAITLRNTGAIIDRFHLAIEGIAAEWYTLGAPATALFPGAEEAVTLTIHPPAGVTTRADTYPITIKAISQDDPTQETAGMVTLVVTAAGSVALEVSPRQAQGRSAIFNATFINRSNADATMTLTGQDDEDALEFRMRPDETVDVAAGEQVRIAVRVRPEERHFVGQPHSYSFTLRGAHEVDPNPFQPDPALSTMARFTYIPRTQALRVPPWLWNPTTLIAKVLAAVVILLLMYAGLKNIFDTKPGTAAAGPNATQVAQLRAIINKSSLTPGMGEAAAMAGIQLTAISQGTVVSSAAIANDLSVVTPVPTKASVHPTAGKGKGTKKAVATAGPKPQIAQFLLIPSGTYVAATWQIVGATTVQLNGQPEPPNGAAALAPDATAALLQATNSAGTVQQVLPVPTLPVPGGAAGTVNGDAGSGGAGGSGAGGSGGAAPPATVLPTATPFPTATPYPTSTLLPTAVPLIPIRAASPIPTSAPPQTAIPPRTATPTPEPTARATATASATMVATATATTTPSASATVTPSVTVTATPTAARALGAATVAVTVVPKAPAVLPRAPKLPTHPPTAHPSSPIPTATLTATASATLVPPTVTSTTIVVIPATATVTATGTLTATATASPTLSATPSATRTLVPTATLTPSQTATAAPTATDPPTATDSPYPTPFWTPTPFRIPTAPVPPNQAPPNEQPPPTVPGPTATLAG